MLLIEADERFSFSMAEASEEQFPMTNMPVLYLRFQRLTKMAIPPKRSNAYSIGYELYSAYDVSVHPGERTVVQTDLALYLPTFTMGLISSKAHFKDVSVDVACGLLDPNELTNVGIVLCNVGNEVVHIARGQCIGQVMILPCLVPQLREAQVLCSNSPPPQIPALMESDPTIVAPPSK